MEIIKGIFCDVEGTLIKIENYQFKLDTELFKILLEKSRKTNVTLWTGGGELYSIKELLESFGIPFPLVSKTDYSGKIVECAYDDLSEQELYGRYKIRAKKFIQIK